MNDTKLRVGVNGAAGRMGQMLVRLIADAAGMELTAALEALDHPDMHRDAGVLAGVGELDVGLSSDLPSIGTLDVMIDFSTPESTVKCAQLCADRGVSLVVGTTGLSDVEIETALSASTQVPMVFAPNMSVGVNVLLDLVGRAATMLGDDYDVEIVETHHRFKKDAPSGTALKFAERIAEVTGRNLATDLVHGRQGQTGLRSQREIGVHAVRAGDVVGEHVITFATLGERVELVHRAHSRETFARGALRAARFIVCKPAGLYTMADVLGFCAALQAGLHLANLPTFPSLFLFFVSLTFEFRVSSFD